MSYLLCCFKSLSLCGFRDCLLGMLAFRPPTDHKYEIEAENQDPKKPPLYKLVLPDPRGNKYVPKDAEGVESSIFWLQTGTSKLIPAILFENKKATTNYVILYSHGNSTDLGRMRLALQEICLALNVHVFAYEYTGYGPSKGKPTDLEVIFGIIAAYNFLTQKLKVKPHQIILYGRSIGTGPSLYLASHPKYPVGGVILHSPIASGLRIMNLNMKVTHSKDLFPNSDFISHVSAHVFIMHGEEDKEVPVDHGKLLSTKCKNLYNPWWVTNAGHNDIDIKFRKVYFSKLNKFVKHVKDFNLTKTETELEEFYKVREWHKKFNHIYFTQAPKLEERYQKYLQKTPKPREFGSFASNSSFLTGNNATNATFKTNTESIITTLGDQTTRKPQETTRSLNDKESEEKKSEMLVRMSNLESCHRLKGSDMELSYSYPSHTARNELKEENREYITEKEDGLNTAQANDHLPIDMSFDQIHMGTAEDPNTKRDLSSQNDVPANCAYRSLYQKCIVIRIYKFSNPSSSSSSLFASFFQLEMTDKTLFDFSNLQDLEKQKQAQNEHLDTLLEQNDLIRKKIPDGPNSLLRAVSDALYFTSHYSNEIQQFLLKHLKHLIATDKLPPRLNMFRGNGMLLKDYTSSPHLTGFDKINLELVASQFKTKIIVYSMTDDNYLSSIIVNNSYPRTIEIVRNKNNHYEPVYSKLYMKKLGVAQNIVLNIVDQAINKETSAPLKNLNEDSYINFEYLTWLNNTRTENGLSQFRITRGKHKKSFSDSFNKPPEVKDDQMKVYDMFTNTKPPEDFLKLISQRKDTVDSNFSINADFGFMDEPWHETPTTNKPKNPPPTSSIYSFGQTTMARVPEGSFSRATPNRAPVSNSIYFSDSNVNYAEAASKTPGKDMSTISPVHFTSAPPPGLTPSRYPQKSFTYSETSYIVPNEALATSPTLPKAETPQPVNAAVYGQATPTRQGVTTFTQGYQGGVSPIHPNNLYTKRTGNMDALTLSVQINESAGQPGFDNGLNQVLSASKEKKKPIILDESKERYTGRLKFFDETKNYGFIIMDGDGSDIFVHMDDLMKANITKDMLRNTKNGVVLRLAFSCMKYIGKYQKSRKATDIEIIQE